MTTEPADANGRCLRIEAQTGGVDNRSVLDGAG